MTDPNDTIPTPPEKPQDPWLVVIGCVAVVLLIALMPLACGATAGLFMRGYDIGSGR